MRADQLSVFNVKCHPHCIHIFRTLSKIFPGTLLINGRSLDANYCKGNHKYPWPTIPMILICKFFKFTSMVLYLSFDLYCAGSPSPPTGCRRLSDVSPGRTGAGYRQRYRGHTRLGVARLGQSPCLSYQKRSSRLVKQRGLSGSGEYMEAGENIMH